MKFLFAAYTAIWIVLFSYLFSLARRQKRLALELRDLKKRIEKR